MAFSSRIKWVLDWAYNSQMVFLSLLMLSVCTLNELIRTFTGDDFFFCALSRAALLELYFLIDFALAFSLVFFSFLTDFSSLISFILSSSFLISLCDEADDDNDNGDDSSNDEVDGDDASMSLSFISPGLGFIGLMSSKPFEEEDDEKDV